MKYVKKKLDLRALIWQQDQHSQSTLNRTKKCVKEHLPKVIISLRTDGNINLNIQQQQQQQSKYSDIHLNIKTTTTST